MQQKKILIITERNDAHALAVAWGLQQLGHIAHLWFLSDFPSSQTLSISNLHLNHPSILINELGINFDIHSISGIWKRGLFSPTIPTYLTKHDRSFARNESILMFHSLFNILQYQCPFWINPLNSNWISHKALQLSIATQVGFLIPPTLISNNPSEIRSFFHSFHGNIIHKSFAPMSWNSKRITHTASTGQVNLEDLEDDRVISSCPGIYQNYITSARSSSEQFYG